MAAARILYMSTLYAPTLKEDPGDADVVSHRLLLRAAMMRKVAAGVYSFLPLGFRVLRKVEQIVREEIDAIGCQEMVMSIIQPGELWHESGRWDDYGPELFRLEDRHQHVFALSPTQEELITAIVRGELRSYKQLPLSLYHIQWKYRDEVRPRFGLLRGREFLMKDAYSFHTSYESLQEHYDLQSAAYGRICERLGLRYVPVAADSGQIGGKVTCEFMALAASGEAEIVHCGCGYAANTEVAEVGIEVHEAFMAGDGSTNGVLPTEAVTDAAAPAAAAPTAAAAGAGTPQPERIHTPIDGSIQALCDFLGIPAAATVKAIALAAGDGSTWVAFIPGDHELGEIKAAKAFNVDAEHPWHVLSEAELAERGLVKGFIGPVGLPRGIRIAADPALQALSSWLTGANEADYHLQQVRPGRDFAVDSWIDLATAQAGDRCPFCGQPLAVERGIEVGQVFQLGTKYAESMGANYMDEDGSEHPFIMGCYGWGVTRSLAAVVEQSNDEAGIIWPISVAPAEVVVLPLAMDDNEVEPAARNLAAALAEAGIEVVLDDRKERPGIKFADADLIGWPYQMIVGKRGLAEGNVELKVRKGMVKSLLPLTEVVSKLVELVMSDRQQYR
ncbi:MAG: proline--tRNA ligase [Actinomycetia bacterium]|nr:proline--tRNA ligase [Actinomycetes bacterium]